MHFIRKFIHDRVIEILFFPTKDQVEDIFTKSLIEAKFSTLRSMLEFQEVDIKFSYRVAFVNPSILSQVFLKGGC
jgi:hypothetical protein